MSGTIKVKCELTFIIAFTLNTNKPDSVWTARGYRRYATTVWTNYYRRSEHRLARSVVPPRSPPVHPAATLLADLLACLVGTNGPETNLPETPRT